MPDLLTMLSDIRHAAHRNNNSFVSDTVIEVLFAFISAIVSSSSALILTTVELMPTMWMSATNISILLSKPTFMEAVLVTIRYSTESFFTGYLGGKHLGSVRSPS